MKRISRANAWAHSVLQHLLVELEADFLDMAGLFVAQQVAGAANVEIVAGELEAGAQLSSDCSTFSRFSAVRSACLFGGRVR
jgi:hypothetical protein